VYSKKLQTDEKEFSTAAYSVFDVDYVSNGAMVWRRNATYFFTFHTISNRNTACKEIRCR